MIAVLAIVPPAVILALSLDAKKHEKSQVRVSGLRSQVWDFTISLLLPET
jgi:hypothetical protein